MSSDLLILDTHIWVWLLNGDDDQLSEEGLEAIADASESGQIGDLCHFGLGGRNAGGARTIAVI